MTINNVTFFKTVESAPKKIMTISHVMMLDVHGNHDDKPCNFFLIKVRLGHGP